MSPGAPASWQVLRWGRIEAKTNLAGSRSEGLVSLAQASKEMVVVLVPLAPCPEVKAVLSQAYPLRVKVLVMLE